MDWFRVWHEMPNDPKWRVIAKKAKQSIPNVICVYLHLLTNASANADERGRTHNFSSEDVAAALDIETEDVDAILTAMEGKVIESGILTGWRKRQPLREDGSAERAAKWREDQKRTQANASERTKTPILEEIREEKIREEKEHKQPPPSAPESARPIPKQEPIAEFAHPVEVAVTGATELGNLRLWSADLQGFIDEVAQAIHEQHPKYRRDIGAGKTSELLIGILRHRKLYSASKTEPARQYLIALRDRHKGHCARSQWTENGGMHAKGLENWLAVTMHRYEQEPPEEIAPVNGHGPPRRKSAIDLALEQMDEEEMRRGA